MPTINKENTDVSTAIFTVNIAKEDYQPQVDKKLGDFRKKANLKGFRKGQVPMSYVKKIYGKQVIADELNELAYKELIKYIADNKLETIGQPLPVEDQASPELDVRNYIDYEFQYEIGLAPSIEIKGLDKSTSVEAYEIEIDDSDVQKEIDTFLSQRGKQEPVDAVSSENDLLSANLIELEGDEPKEGGLNKFSMIALRDIEDEELKKHILTLKKTDTFDTDIHKLVSKEQSENIRKHLLFIDEDVEFNDTFRVEITGITAMTLPEITAKLLVDAVGPEKAEKYVAEFLPKEKEETQSESELDIPEVVDIDLGDEETPAISEEEKKAATEGLKTELRVMIEEQYENAAQNYIFKKVFKKLETENTIELPETYLKRWLKVNNEGREIADQEYKASAAYLSNNFLVELAAKQLDVYVSQADIEAQMRQDYYERSGANPEDPKAEASFQEFYKMMLQYDEMIVSKRQSSENTNNIAEKLEDIVTVSKKKVNTQEFMDIIAAENEAAKKEAEALEKAEANESLAEV